jgi:hypothetical protein
MDGQGMDKVSAWMTAKAMSSRNTEIELKKRRCYKHKEKQIYGAMISIHSLDFYQGGN